MDEIVICLGSSCFARGNDQHLEEIRQFLEQYKLLEKVVFRGELCSANCNCGPNLKINGTLYSDLNAAKIVQLLKQHFKI